MGYFALSKITVWEAHLKALKISVSQLVSHVILSFCNMPFH